jgi:hypothetical protein
MNRERRAEFATQLIRRAPHAEEHNYRPSRRALRALLRMRQLCVSKHARRLGGIPAKAGIKSGHDK